ncbi:MAG TPA: hypothetical protein VEW07_09140 [Solirubrobacterales bacterium]|nr:hypothetical protein [Solirubrobacterales bacterium]
MRRHAAAPSASGFNRPTIVAALCAAFMLVAAVSAGAAGAAGWVNAGNFAASGGGFLPAPTGVAVDQTGDNVYATNFFSATFTAGPLLKFGLDGTAGSPASFGVGDDGVAVDQSSGNVYGLNDLETLAFAAPGPSSIQAYTPAGDAVGSPIPVTTLTNGSGGRTIQIAAGAGNVYVPSLPDDNVEVFKADGTPLPSINGSGPNALHNPHSVATDSAGNVYVADTAVSEQQSIAVDATGGTFTLTFEGQTTAPIAFDAEGTGGVQPALEALSTIGAGNVSVTGSSGAYAVAFQGKLAGLDVPQMSADSSALTGGTATATIGTTATGLPGRVMKFDSGGVFQSVVASGFTTGLGVDPVAGTVFVVFGQGETTHVVAYDSAGAQLADFGGGDFSSPVSPAYAFSQAAVHSDTGRVYVSDPGEGAVEMYDPLPAPVVVTKAATAVTKTAAKVNATVDAEGLEADCEFAYDDNPGFSSPTTAPCVPSPVIGSTATPVSASLSGLAVNTTYYFHVVAENDGGESVGTDLQFTTLPDAPVAKTNGASGQTQTTATLNGSVNASGVSTACKFEYGTSASYGKTAPCSVDPVSGSTETAVSAALSGLSAGTTYHYRLVATNAGGSTNGGDATFSTLAHTCATNPALCPAPPVTPPVTPPPTSPPPPTKPLKCKKGFKKKTVKGKKKCVKVKKHKKNKH